MSIDPERPLHVPLEEQQVEQNAYDTDFFSRIVQDAGRWAFGVIFVEVWVMNSARTHLIRPDHGWWMDPYATDCGEDPKFNRLTDPSRDDYLEPSPLAPGCGLPGVLYAQTQHRNSMMQRDLSGRRNSEGGWGAASGSAWDIMDSTSTRTEVQSHRRLASQRYRSSELLNRNVTWREVGALADDPDQPYNPRLKFLANAGLGWAAGVPFSVGRSEGLVIFMARDTANICNLIDPVNTDYLTHATVLVGSAYALRIPRLRAENARREERQQTLRRVNAKIHAIRLLKQNLGSYVKQQSERLNRTISAGEKKMWLGRPLALTSDSPSRCATGWAWITRKAMTSWRKCLGANVLPPPTFTWQQTLWTFGGAFVTLMILTNLNIFVVEKFGSEYSIVLGPFGALMTLQYGLAAAPSSQPRNAILGQTFGLLVAHGIGQSTQLDPWMKQSLATSLAIAVMAKLGVMHPPAGAAALLFSTGSRSWPQVGMMLVGNAVAIACATLFNNLNDKRQYPTFWGFRELRDNMFQFFGTADPKEKNS